MRRHVVVGWVVVGPVVSAPACDRPPEPEPAAASTAPASRAAASGSAAAAGSEVAGGSAPQAPPVKLTFESDALDREPSGFLFARTGKGHPGKWVVRIDPEGDRGANVLAQVDPDETDERFPVAIAKEPEARDMRIVVQCKMMSGKADQSCGAVLRYRDERTYYVARANALENDVRLYVVQNGRRSELAKWSGAVTHGPWHTLAFEARGDRLEVLWNGQTVIEHHDGTLGGPGRAGVWTKSDAVTLYDDIRIERL